MKIIIRCQNTNLYFKLIFKNVFNIQDRLKVIFLNDTFYLLTSYICSFFVLECLLNFLFNLFYLSLNFIICILYVIFHFLVTLIYSIR